MNLRSFSYASLKTSSTVLSTRYQLFKRKSLWETFPTQTIADTGVDMWELWGFWNLIFGPSYSCMDIFT